MTTNMKQYMGHKHVLVSCTYWRKHEHLEMHSLETVTEAIDVVWNSPPVGLQC